MENKQTAVKWLLDWIRKNQYFVGNDLLQAFEQAKAMEKEQIVETYNEGALDGLQLGEQYYNFVFNS